MIDFNYPIMAEFYDNSVPKKLKAGKRNEWKQQMRIDN
jgi:hypothetical protein